MGTPRNYTNETFGSVFFLGRHPLNPRHWLIRWSCCGREQEISPERAKSIAKTLPQRCVSCVTEHTKASPEYYSPRAVRERELRAAQKMLENRPEEAAPQGAQDRLGRFWPELSKLGPRWS